MPTNVVVVFVVGRAPGAKSAVDDCLVDAVVGMRAKTQCRQRCYWLTVCLVSAVCSTLAKETGVVTFAVCLLTDSDVVRLLLRRRSSPLRLILISYQLYISVRLCTFSSVVF